MCELPVCGHIKLQLTAIRTTFKVITIQPLRQRCDNVVKRWCVTVEVDEYPVEPDLCPNRPQARSRIVIINAIVRVRSMEVRATP